jgi:hypothetical protein
MKYFKLLLLSSSLLFVDVVLYHFALNFILQIRSHAMRNVFDSAPKLVQSSVFHNLNNYDDNNKGNNKITELRTILQRESQNS